MPRKGVLYSPTILRKQDAVGAYIWASIKMLTGGGAEILCGFGGDFEKSVRSRERAYNLAIELRA